MGFIESFYKLDDVEPAAVPETKELSKVDKHIQKGFVKHGTREFEGVRLSASGIYFLCARQAIYETYFPPEEQSIDLKSILMMDCGTLIHDILQNRVLGPLQILKGTWKSFEGTYEGYQKNKNDRYIEKRFFHSDLPFSGHTDGLIDFDHLKSLCKIDSPHTGDMILEIKTTSKEKLKTINYSKDIPDWYKMQTEIYQEITGVRQTLFWYLDRDGFSSKFLVYKWNGQHWESARHKVEAIVSSVESKRMPALFCTKKTSCRFCSSEVGDEFRLRVQDLEPRTINV